MNEHTLKSGRNISAGNIQFTAGSGGNSILGYTYLKERIFIRENIFPPVILDLPPDNNIMMSYLFDRTYLINRERYISAGNIQFTAGRGGNSILRTYLFERTLYNR